MELEDAPDAHRAAFNEWKQHNRDLIRKIRSRIADDELLDAALELLFAAGFKAGLDHSAYLLERTANAAR